MPVSNRYGGKIAISSKFFSSGVKKTTSRALVSGDDRSNAWALQFQAPLHRIFKKGLITRRA
jgi:hypothetical protein